jgi:hypothetical protein
MAQHHKNSDERSRESNDTLKEILAYAIAIIALFIYVYINLRQPLWFYSRYSLFMVLSHIPYTLIEPYLSFFGLDGNGNIITTIFKDLSSHQEDFEFYYYEDETGISKKKTITYVAYYFYAPILIFLTIIFIYKGSIIKKGLLNRIGEKHAMYKYFLLMSRVWVYSRVIAAESKNISSQKNLHDGWYSVSLWPIEYAKRMHMTVDIKKSRRSLLMVRERQEFTLNRDKTFEVVSANLGKIYEGVHSFNELEKWIVSVLVLHILGRVHDSRKLNRQINIYYGIGIKKDYQTAIAKRIKATVDNVFNEFKDDMQFKPHNESDFDKPYDPIIESFEVYDTEEDLNVKGRRELRKTFSNHSYVKTIILSLHKKSWAFGVLASSEMLYVKKYDRDFWYVLSQQGRGSAFAEVSGCWAHFLYEEESGVRCLPAQCKSAFIAFDENMYKTHSNYRAHFTHDVDFDVNTISPSPIGGAGASSWN